MPFPLPPASLCLKMVSSGAMSSCIMHLYDYALNSWELPSDTQILQAFLVMLNNWLHLLFIKIYLLEVQT